MTESERVPAAALAAAVAGALNDELTLLLNELIFLSDAAGREHPLAGRVRSAQHAVLRCTVITARLLEFSSQCGEMPDPEPLEQLLARP